MLDTSAAIDLRDHSERAAKRLQALNERPAISTITRVELEGGVYADPLRTGARRRALDALLRRFPTIEFDDEMAIAYGRIVHQQGFSRRKIIDRMIAATALVRGLILITMNGADFDGIDGLELEIWND